MKKIVVFFIMIFLITGCNNKNIQKEYSSNLFYMDTYILVKVYSEDEDKAKNALDEVSKIYKEYHELVDKYNSYDHLKNVYYINNNDSNDDQIQIDERLYELIEYSLSYHDKSNQLLDINIGNVIDVWKSYMEKQDGVPSLAELEVADSEKINIVLLGNNKILNNNPNIDLGAIAKGYVTEVVGDYLEDVGITKYLINAGGNVKVGDHYNNGKYRIGIENPTDTSLVYQTINGNNISIVTSGSYQRYYEYGGKRYSHIINPKTLYPSSYFESVTVIASDSGLADVLSTTLFMMSYEEGLEYLKDFPDVQAVWYLNDGTIVKTEGFSKYE